MKLSRRTALGGIGVIALETLLESKGVGIVTGGLKTADYACRRANYVSPLELNELFKEKALETVVTNSIGSRTLMVIGDTHLAFGKTYVDFIATIKERFRLARVFMEGVYKTSRGDDPHLEYFRDQGPYDEVDYTRRDPQGYFRIKRSNIVNGIENRELCLDLNVLDRIDEIFLNYLFTDHLDVNEVRKLYGSLRNKNFSLGNLSEITTEKKREFLKKLRVELDKRFILDRNSVFVQAIDEQLRYYELGLLIVGEGHISQDRNLARPKHLGNYSLLSDLAKRGIGSVYLSVGEAVKFNS